MLKDAFEARLGKKVPSDHAALASLVEFAVVLINRYEVGHDGKTPYERLRGKQSKLLGLEFGERLHFRRCRAAGRMAKLDVSWQDGVFMGYPSLSGEVVVETADGVLRTRTVRRRPEEQRWTSDCLDMVGGLPWKPNPSDDLGGEVMPAIDMPMAELEVEIRRLECCEGEIVPRRLDLRTRDFKEHGATRGCKGCIAMARGGKGVTHTEACRQRMTEAIAETDEGRVRAKAAEAKIKEFRAGGREVDFEEPAAKRARRSDQSMVAEVPDSCAGAAQDPMEDDAEDRMEKQKRASGWEDLAERTKRPRKDDDDEDMLLEVACQFNDDRSGKKLDPKKVRQARDEELVELERRVYVEADVEECVKVTGKKPIQVRWVDVDKGFGVYRSRLVAKDFRPKNKIDDREGLCAATPPLEVVKFLIMQAATKCRQGVVRKVMLIDIS